jgi:maleate cis-trans isomerase
MRTIKQKLKYILDEINEVQNYNLHVKNAKEIKIEYYKLSEKQLKDVPPSKILQHSFGGEVLSLGEMLEKKEIINKIIATKKIKVVRHKFAPELNKLQIIGKEKNTIDAPYLIKISESVTPYESFMHPKLCNLATFLCSKNISYLNNLLILN